MPMLLFMSTTASTMSFLQLRVHLSLLTQLHFGEVHHVVRAHVAQLIKLYSALHCRQDLGKCIDSSDAVLDRNGLVSGDKVKLVEDNLVCKGDLLKCLIHLALLNFVVETTTEVLGIG